MPFPNVAAHRRMPHLPNPPKPSQEHLHPEQQQQQQADHTSYNQGQDNASSHPRLMPGPSAPQQLLEDGIALDFQQQQLLNARPASPLGLMSPSASTSPAMNSHDSKLIRSALYDAFGCLYHPTAHTKHSMSTAAAAIRSGDVTPLMGLSPKASPLLRPNLGPSAPITPLELSDEGSAAGYFALHVPSSPSSPALNGSASTGSGSTRHHGHHYHHHHHHPHHHHRQPHTSSQLSSTFTSEDHDEMDLGNRSATFLSQQSSMDMTFNPVEHPVLSSLQTLSITHPRPPEHYHPHLGHELGHDIVPIDESSVTASNSLDIPPQSSQQPLPPLNTALPQSLQKPMGHNPSSPFPMDHSEHDSISGFGQQGLV
ncbi:hypothetical protein BGZ54_009145 [Gamsiella multidivaricata]|nr:hypothetical protein BGZ54_009145 [Gamsiella multidivaricata]